MLVNIYNNISNSYISLNIDNIDFNDMLLLFEEINSELLIFDKNNSNFEIFNNNYDNYVFIKSSSFLGYLLTLLENYNFNENNLIIFEIDDMLYYVPLSFDVFIILEGLLSMMYIKNNVSISQRVILNLENIKENEQNNSR